MDELLMDTVFAPRDDDDAAVDAALERAAQELAEEQRLAAEEFLREADDEIERAQAAGTDHYPERR